jgi:hypothetical protein
VCSDIKRPAQALNEHPRPTDHRGGKGGEIEEHEETAAHSLTLVLKRADQLEAALLPIELAE